MIFLYSGTPGSGKSLHQASDIYKLLSRGRPVIANFDLNLSCINPKRCGEFYYIDNSILRPEYLIRYSKIYFSNHKFHEGAIKLFIDESQLLFNCREWNTPGRKEWLSFFTQHRKYGYDIILVAQFDRMLDRQVRSLIEYEVIHRKVRNFGKWGFLFNLFALGDLFIAVSVWYPIKEKIDATFFKGRKKYYDMYNTLNTFDEKGV